MIQGACGLTEQQQALVISFAILGSVTEAAQDVGCRADQAGHTLRLPHVQEALLGECRHRLARAAPVAVAALLGIVENETLAKTRLGLDAAKALLDRAGIVPQKAGEGRQDDKRDLSDLSPLTSWPRLSGKGRTPWHARRPCRSRGLSPPQSINAQSEETDDVHFLSPQG